MIFRCATYQENGEGVIQDIILIRLYYLFISSSRSPVYLSGPGFPLGSIVCTVVIVCYQIGCTVVIVFYEIGCTVLICYFLDHYFETLCNQCLSPLM